MAETGEGTVGQGSIAVRAIGVGLVLGALGAGIWTARAPIATGLIDSALAERGVRARYRIADLGLTRQRLTDVVIGDPARPDLVADWIELVPDISTASLNLTQLSAGRVEARARLVDGRLVMGDIDRLRPPPSDAPFTLPSIDLMLDDGLLLLETPLGRAAIRLKGKGLLNNGFAGQMRVASTTLGTDSCRAETLTAALAISVVDAQPRLQGPVRAASLQCAETSVKAMTANADVVLDRRLDRWQGNATLASGSIRHPRATLAGLSGVIDLDGSLQRTSGKVELRGQQFAMPQVSAAAILVAGRYRVGTQAVEFEGRATASDGALGRQSQKALAAIGNSAGKTPAGPLISQVVNAAVSAVRRFGGTADISLLSDAAGYALTIGRATLVSGSGARATLSDGSGLAVSSTGVAVDGRLAMAGGGLPEAAFTLRRAQGRAIAGTGFVRPFAAGGARLALSGMDFSAVPGGTTRLNTRMVLSGPLGDGRVEGLSVPLEARWDGRRRFMFNPGCTPVEAGRLATGGVEMDRPRLTVCAEGPALAVVDGTRVSGGARLAAPNLVGKLNGTPIAVSAESARYGFADQRFGADGVKVTLGSVETVSRLDVGKLDGQITGGDVGGTFANAGGSIGQVPLKLSGSTGTWRFANDQFRVDGGLTVSDAADTPRFYPLSSADIVLLLENRQLKATGTLVAPGSTMVTKVAITHDLDRGTGSADLAVPGLSFDKQFQPDRLTPITFGVIAEVVGQVSGEGHFRWTPDGLTSTGVFRARDVSLDAAFGPVSGLSGEIRFTDLINLVSAPGQLVRLGTVNPGVPVNDGEIRYQTLADQKVAIERGRWPFAGGALVLDPTVLDFNVSAERRLTFHVEGVDAELFLHSFDFKNLDATGIVDGTLPMVFNARGGRIDGGHLTMRPGGGTIAYVGEISQRDLGFWGNLAFQSLKSLSYRELEVDMNGPLDGEMITEVRFAGLKQGKGAKTNFLIRRLQQLPLVFNVRIQAPFRQLLDSAQSYYDPKRLIERNLPALLEAQKASGQAQSVQPTASEPVRQGDRK